MGRSLRGSVLVSLLVVGVLPAQAAGSFPGRNGDVLLSLTAGYNPPGWSDDVGGPFTNSLKMRDRRTGRVRLLRRCIETRTPTGSRGFVQSGCQLSDGRFSPDGRWIAFVIATFDGRGGFTTRVALMRADGSRLREVPASPLSRASVRAPLWSPDGKSLIMFGVPPTPNANNAPDLYRISLDGTRTRRVTFGGVGEADWSASGEIALTRPDGRNPSALFRMRIGGRQQRVLDREVSAPSWSPGGTRIAFTGFVRGEAHVFTASRTGRGLKRFTRFGGEDPVWSPDGRRMLFLRWDSTLVSAPLGGGRSLPVASGDNPESSGRSIDHADWQPLPRKRSG